MQALGNVYVCTLILERCPVWCQDKGPCIHEGRDQSKNILKLCRNIYYERGRGYKLCIWYVSFESHYACMDETSVYCITTIICSAPLEISFCTLSVLFTLEERVILTCLGLKQCSESMKWTKLTISRGNFWRAGPLLSFLLFASGEQNMWITFFCVPVQQIAITLWEHGRVVACIHLNSHLRGYTAWL